MTNPTTHGQVPEALIDLIDAYADRCGSIYNAKTEAARNAVIEALSEVQALSAAPAVDITTAGEMQAFEAWYKQDCVIEGAAAKVAAKAAWKARAMLAASPTPPAEARRRYDAAMEQAAPKAAPGEQLGYKQALGSNNCMQCCVSYMLGLPLADVPHFADGGGWGQFASFVESKGYSTVMLPGEHEPEADYLASGRTERGTPHMVVMNGGKLVFDPHPSCSGLSSVQCVWLLAKRAAPQPAPDCHHRPPCDECAALAAQGGE